MKKKRGTRPTLHSAKIYRHIIIFSLMTPCFLFVRLVPTVRMKLLSLYSTVKMEWVRIDERLDRI